MGTQMTSEIESTKINKGASITYYTAFSGCEEYRDLPYNPKLIEHDKYLGFDTAIEVILIDGVVLFSGDRHVAETLLMEDTMKAYDEGEYVCEDTNAVLTWDGVAYVNNRLAEIDAEIVNFTYKEIYG